MTPRLLSAFAVALLACEAEPDMPICEMSARVSSMQIRVVGFEQSYGDVEHAELAFCLSGAPCGVAAITAVENGYECRTDASLSAPSRYCMLEPNGTLVIMVELQATPSTLHGEHSMTLELSGPGLSEVSGEATIVLWPVEGHGEGCGITHVSGSVTVDATLSELVTG